MRIAEYRDGKMVYRDATAEEESQYIRQQEETQDTSMTQSEHREQAYNEEHVIPWDGSMLTVTEAAQRWAYYAAEGNADKTDALTALIAVAKESIRERWPDE